MEEDPHESGAGLLEASQIAERFHLPLKEVKQVEKTFKIKISKYYASLIKEKGDCLYRQVVPDCKELEFSGGDIDPLSEEEDSPVPSIIHRYPDRVLFLVSNVCASYCRFCTRRRKVGDASKITQQHIEEGINYIREHTEVRDVILSGGDPFLLSVSTLERIIRPLRQIPHLEIVRIGTRVPCFLPELITSKLARMLKQYHPLYVNVHFNHPDEVTPQAMKALAKLADAGIPLGNQTVLLKGVNDDPRVMKLLMQKLLKARVRPYYIYQADYVKGSDHLRTKVEKGLEIIEALRGWTSGLAVPHFVIDAPGGGGKIPLLPNYVLSMNKHEVILRNYAGDIFVYPQVKEETSSSQKEFATPEMEEELVSA